MTPLQHSELALCPPLGAKLRDKQNNGTQVFFVSDVFRGSSYMAMLLRWHDGNRERGQVFTCKNWQDRWEVVK